MTRYVVACNREADEVHFWQCNSPADPEAGGVVSERELSLLARREAVAILQFDADKNVLVEGLAVLPHEWHVETTELPSKDRRLDGLPTVERFFALWRGDAALRDNTRQSWAQGAITRSSAWDAIDQPMIGRS